MDALPDMNDTAVPEGFRSYVYGGSPYFQPLGTRHAREWPDDLMLLGLRPTAANGWRPMRRQRRFSAAARPR